MKIDKFLDKIYLETNENIKFAEAKNAALITLNSALIAFVSKMIFDKDIILRYRISLLIFVSFLTITLLLSLFSFRATTGTECWFFKNLYSTLDDMNQIKISPKMNMYYSYIHKYYKNATDFLGSIDGITDTDKTNFYNIQKAQQIIDLSKIAYRKYTIFNIAVFVEISSFITMGILAIIFLIIK